MELRLQNDTTSQNLNASSLHGLHKTNSTKRNC